MGRPKGFHSPSVSWIACLLMSWMSCACLSAEQQWPQQDPLPFSRGPQPFSGDPPYKAGTWFRIGGGAYFFRDREALDQYLSARADVKK